MAAVLSLSSVQDPENPSTQAPIIHYENSTNGLKKLTEDVVQAAKDNNQSKLLQLTSSMILPDPEKWFKKTFGESFGPNYAEEYAKDRDNLPVTLASSFLAIIQEGYTNFEVQRFIGNCDESIHKDEFQVLIARDREEPLSVLRFHNSDTTKTLKFFAYVDGGFRFLGVLGLPRRAGSQTQGDSIDGAQTSKFPDRVQVAGDIQKAKLIHAVQPIYPSEARQNHISGTIQIHAIISKQGTVSEMSLVSGPCILAEPAFKAVAQWRFTPTIFQGIPVEVECKFDVNFKMSM